MPPRAAMHGKQLRKFGETLQKGLPAKCRQSLFFVSALRVVKPPHIGLCGHLQLEVKGLTAQLFYQCGRTAEQVNAKGQLISVPLDPKRRQRCGENVKAAGLTGLPACRSKAIPGVDDTGVNTPGRQAVGMGRNETQVHGGMVTGDDDGGVFVEGLGLYPLHELGHQRVGTVDHIFILGGETVAAVLTQPSAIVTPAMIWTPYPIQTSLSIMMSFSVCPCSRIGIFGSA